MYVCPVWHTSNNYSIADIVRCQIIGPITCGAFTGKKKMFSGIKTFCLLKVWGLLVRSSQCMMFGLGPAPQASVYKTNMVSTSYVIWLVFDLVSCLFCRGKGSLHESIATQFNGRPYFLCTIYYFLYIIHSGYIQKPARPDYSTVQSNKTVSAKQILLALRIRIVLFNRRQTYYIMTEYVISHPGFILGKCVSYRVKPQLAFTKWLTQILGMWLVEMFISRAGALG